MTIKSKKLKNKEENEKKRKKILRFFFIHLKIYYKPIQFNQLNWFEL